MSTESKNGATVPVGSDPYALTADLLKMMESAGLVYPVPDAATMLAIPAPTSGMVVLREDRNGELWRFDGSDWVPIRPLPPFGSVGRTAGFQGVSNTGTIVQFDAAQELRGGMTFDNATDSLVIPVPGLYRVTSRGYITGSQGYQGFVKSQRYFAGVGPWLDITGSLGTVYKPDGADYVCMSQTVKEYNAGDKINLIVGGSNGAGSTWGTNGYDGASLQVEWFGPAGAY